MFLPREELDEQRKAAEAKRVAFMYDGRCRELTPEQVQKNVDQGLPHVIRFLVPRDPATTVAVEDPVTARW